MPASGLTPLDLALSPVIVAKALRHLPGMVFLDSGASHEGRFSILGVEPDLILQGRTLSQLETELAARSRTGADSGLPSGAAIGSFDYEGEYCMGFYDRLLIYDHLKQSWHGEVALLKKMVEPQHPSTASGPKFSSEMDAGSYCHQVRKVQEFIAAGDIYQANISHPFHAVWDGDGYELFESLRHCSPAPFSAFLNLGGREIISSSPELFLKISGRHIVTRPIKGTRPRSREQARDELAAYELLTSPKEISELVMITDLERNDLGKVCEYGSVQVTELLKLERFEQVFHLVSTVEGHLRDNVSQVAAFSACFPGGSITGAPKKRAREIIEELEQCPRGLYTGAIGYFGYNGESQFSMAIRTLCKTGNELTFSVGAGIVADSVPKQEYQETLDKAAGILLAAERLRNL